MISRHASHDESMPRPSRVIAEALVFRQGPRQIADRAVALGLPRPLTQAILVACASTASEPIGSRRRVGASAAR